MTNQAAKRDAHHRRIALGVYSSREAVEDALREFDLAGFPQTDMSVVLPDGNQAQAPNRDIRDTDAKAKNTTGAHGTGAGAGIGAAPSLNLGRFTAFTDLAVPGLGTLLIAGPLIGILADGAASDAIGALAGVGIAEREAKLYEERLKQGGVLVSIHADSVSEANRARALLIQTGATDTASASMERV
jgi:Heat induced stress protein YflT